ncbi:MAG TPA: ribonuclease P protein component [Mycobacteriales bacterium]|nr:ribonuclease P protein component [Mycobacteriales bacterium]
MLPAAHRLTSRSDFTEVVRQGQVAARGALTVHLLMRPAPVEPGASAAAPSSPTRAGLVVGRAVGGSVVRHRTARRLRALLRPHLEQLPPGSRLVVRANGAAGQASSAQLGRDLGAALARLRP